MAKKYPSEVFEFKPIGSMQSLFKDRFAVPRQPGLASQVPGIIKMNPDPDLKTALRRLDEFSHLWIVFVFHDHGGKKWKPSIRPPRLGGNTKVGVLSSRSPHRPNPIGISAVALEKIDFEAKGGVEIHVRGIDLIDGTPILDVKPYIPYADAIPEAKPGWACDEIQKYPVRFATTVDSELKKLIVGILELDPRPAFQKRKFPVGKKISVGKKYGFDLLDYDVKYEIQENGFLVLGIY
jgi:tRNA-Thr(GGU) m(6)t(6)A37 methyltransferase TsaA